MQNVVVMGECMVEFSLNARNNYKQSFAGDVYNTAVYLKRLQQGASNVAFFTAIGNDIMSDGLLGELTENGISTTLVKRVNDRQLGSYLIQTTDEGERSFVYWRDNSAAKVAMSQLNDDEQNKLIEQCDLFYFSGISIAILDEKDRNNFWLFVKKLRSSGTRIVFDSNYRSILWLDEDDTKQQFSNAFEQSDIVFAGIEDFFLLYQLNSFAELDSFFNDYSVAELIIKNGADGVFYCSPAEQFTVDIDQVENVIDTTSAGDAFNSGFLSAKMNGFTAIDAIKQACHLSACVIQHKGAIIDNQVFNDFISTQSNS
jgi:2-dehydro-3-deoxygluconokinase